MLPVLSTLSPNAAVLLLTLGLVLIAVELNRPGFTLPGALGLLASLLAVATLIRQPPDWLAFGLLLASATILLSQLRWNVHFFIACLGTAAGIFGFLLFPHVAPWVAIPCGLALGAGTIILTRIARRARRNKGLD